MKTIPGYEGHYKITESGEVISLPRLSSIGRKLKQKTLKPFKNSDGYLSVELSKDGIVKSFKIHRLVAQTYLGNTEGKIVLHLDDDQTNNAKDNLKIGTQLENVNDMYSKGRQGGSIQKEIIQIDLDGNIIKKWISQLQVKKSLGINQSSISKCCRGIKKTAGGFRWEYSLTQY